jgi:hypothetical protein
MYRREGHVIRSNRTSSRTRRKFSTLLDKTSCHPCPLVIFSVPSLVRIIYSLVAVLRNLFDFDLPMPPTIRPLGPDANTWNACHPAGAQGSGRRGSMRLRKMAALPKRNARQKVQYVSQTYDDTCMLLPKSPAHHDERVHVR